MLDPKLPPPSDFSDSQRSEGARPSGAPERIALKTALAKGASMAELMSASRTWPLRTSLPESKQDGKVSLSEAEKEECEGARNAPGGEEESKVRSEASRVRLRRFRWKC